MKINFFVIFAIILFTCSFSKLAISKENAVIASKSKISKRTTTQTEASTAAKTEVKAENSTAAKTEVKAEAKTEVKAEAKTQTKTDAKAKTKSKTKTKEKGVNHKINAAKNAFPNPNVNSVSKEDLKDNAKKPFSPLSAVLGEMNWEDKLKRQNFLDAIKYTYYKFTKAEANMIFNIVDVDKDDLIDMKEWHDFTVLYVMPFESCDGGHDNLLSLKDFTECFAKDPKRQQINFRRRHEEKKEVEELIMNIISTRGRPVFNIFDYIIFRRALFSWTKCTSSSKFMTKSAFKCAITTFISNKYIGKTDTDDAFNVGLGFGQGANLIDLDFISYLRISYYTLAFVTFNESNPQPILEKLKFLKAITSDSFPNNFTEAEVKMMYNLTNDSNNMNFATFAFFFHYHRVFDRYSTRTPFKLTEKEYYEFIKDNEIPLLIRYKIDRSLTHFNQQQYLEASLTLGKKRLDEHKYFSFKQDGTVEGKSSNDKKTIFNTGVALLYNKTSRKQFYYINSITIKDENVWDRECMYKAFLYSNLYIKLLELTGGSSNSKSIVDFILRAYTNSTPSVAPSIRANPQIFRAIPDELSLDLLLFLNVHNCLRKSGAASFNPDEYVNEVAMKVMMQDFGMEYMPDTVLDTGFKGRDKLGRRQYSVLEAFKNMMVVQGVAAEQARGKRDIKMNDLVKNPDKSRGFPDKPRRMEKSPFV